MCPNQSGPFIRIDHENFRKKIRLVRRVTEINIYIMLLLLSGASIWHGSGIIDLVLSLYRSNLEIFFKEPNISNVKTFTKWYLTFYPVMEEFLFRYPVLLLLNKNLYIKYRLTKPVILFAVLILNTVWAYQHVVFIPIFITGLSFYWLVYKTRAIWPALTCHIVLNLLLYLLVQALCYMGITLRTIEKVEVTIAALL